MISLFNHEEANNPAICDKMVDFKCIMIHKISQRKKHQYCIISLYVESWKSWILKNKK